MLPIDITVPALNAPTLPALLLSAPTSADAQRIADICQEADVQRWAEVPTPYTYADATHFIAAAVAGWANGANFTWALRELNPHGSARLLGMISVSKIAVDSGKVSYWLSEPARNEDAAVRALNAIIDMLFDPKAGFAWRRLEWSTNICAGIPNWLAWKVAWRLGFTREGKRRAVQVKSGQCVDQWIASLLVQDPREPLTPWDGPMPAGVQPHAHGNGSAHTNGANTTLVAQAHLGQRQGDDPEALVRQFHQVYDLPICTDAPSLKRSRLSMRMSLIAEEFSELIGAVYGSQARNQLEATLQQIPTCDDGSRDLIQTADALADLVYVIYGMALETGIDLAAVLTEVQRSNMSKLGADSKPIYREDGKVLKGPGYFPPDIAGVLGVK